MYVHSRTQMYEAKSVHGQFVFTRGISHITSIHWDDERNTYLNQEPVFLNAAFADARRSRQGTPHEYSHIKRLKRSTRDHFLSGQMMAFTWPPDIVPLPRHGHARKAQATQHVSTRDLLGTLEWNHTVICSWGLIRSCLSFWTSDANTASAGAVLSMQFAFMLMTTCSGGSQ